MAIEHSILGLPSTNRLRKLELVNESIRRRIIHSFPNGGAPLSALLAWSKIQPLNDVKHTWYEDIWQSARCKLRGTNPITSNAPTDGNTNDGTAIASAKEYTKDSELFIKVDTVSRLALNDLIRLANLDIILRITKIEKGVGSDVINGYIGVIPVRSFTLSADDVTKIKAGYIIDVIGSAYAEGSTSGSARGMSYPCSIMNQTQIFKEPYEFTGSALKMDLKFDSTGPYAEKAQEACRDHMVKIEKTLLFGQRSTTFDDAGKEIRTMSGILEFLKLWDKGATGLKIDGSAYAPYDFKDESIDDTDSEKRYIANASGQVSIDRLERWLSNINLYHDSKTTDRLCLCGSGVVLAMSQMMRDQGSYTWEKGQDWMGVKCNRLITAMGDVIFMTHPLFNENPLYRNSALFLDIWSLNFRPLQDRDTKIIKNIQANDEDVRRDQWITEGTLEFWKPMNHLFVENFSVYDKTAK